jgi:hypothetical protein
VIFETDCRRARKDAERLDLKPFVRSFARIGILVGERFLGVLSSGDEDMGESASWESSNGWSSSQPCELAICLNLLSDATRWADEKPLKSLDTKSSEEPSDGIDSLDTDLVERTEASTPSLPTNIWPSTSSSRFPNRPSKFGLLRLPERPPSVPGFTSSKSNLLNSATWSPAGNLLPLGRLLSGIVVAVSRSRADPILLGSEARAMVGNDGWDADDAASEGLAAAGDGLRLRCVGIVTGFDLGVPDAGLLLGDLDLLRGGPASNAAA